MSAAALALVFLIAADAQPLQPHTIPGLAARALTVAIGVGGAGMTSKADLTDSSVAIADLPACYRIRLIDASDPKNATTIRMGKSTQSVGTGCGDEKAPEVVLPGPEAQAVLYGMREWSGGTLSGAPPVQNMVDGTFTVKTTTVPNSDPAKPAKILFEIHTPGASCPPLYSFDLAKDTFKRLTRTC